MSSPLTVVVPVYNEGANFAEWWRQIGPHLPPEARVHVVYDFDLDDTLPVARSLAREGAPIDLVRNPERGVLGAIKTGLTKAPPGPVLVSMADLSDDFSAIPAILAAYEAGARVVVPSRYMKGGRQVGGPWLKGQLSRWGGVSLHLLAGFPVHDATNSFRLYDADFVRSIAIESSGGFEIGFEITLKAWMAGLSIVEVPCTWRDRVAGQSRFALRKWLPRYARLWFRALSFGFPGRGKASR
ncbi:MAG: glycosyltransferase [Acidobacteriota bacterium]